MRGEYICLLSPRGTIWELPPRARRILHLPIYSVGCTELPPRARRIHTPSEMVRLESGTTSACAENTSKVSLIVLAIVNYLRVRGEYPTRPRRSAHHLELPPRARRILRARVSPHPRFGTTSACAENTSRRVMCRGAGWNYLRVRGEYREPGLIERHRWELPPRARRILRLKPG